VVVRPAGYSVEFTPRVVLRGDRGAVLARDGDRIRLGQVNFQDHAGRFEDPYLASGLVFEGCYPYIARR
jgi:hypothetical protein